MTSIWTLFIQKRLSPFWPVRCFLDSWKYSEDEFFIIFFTFIIQNTNFKCSELQISICFPILKRVGLGSHSLALWLFCLLFLSHEELGLYHSGMQCPCNVCQSYTHTHTPHGCMWISAKWDSQLYSHRFQRTICLQPPLNTWGPVKLYWK